MNKRSNNINDKLMLELEILEYQFRTLYKQNENKLDFSVFGYYSRDVCCICMRKEANSHIIPIFNKRVSVCLCKEHAKNNKLLEITSNMRSLINKVSTKYPQIQVERCDTTIDENWQISNVTGFKKSNDNFYLYVEISNNNKQIKIVPLNEIIKTSSRII
jgi:hypothetical protein